MKESRKEAKLQRIIDSLTKQNNELTEKVGVLEQENRFLKQYNTASGDEAKRMIEELSQKRVHFNKLIEDAEMLKVKLQDELFSISKAKKDCIRQFAALKKKIKKR